MEFQIPAGKVYVSHIIDCSDEMVVSRTIGKSQDANRSTRCWMQP